MRGAADWLERRPQLGRDVFARGRPELHLGGGAGDLTELLRACLVALRVPEAVAETYCPGRPRSGGSPTRFRAWTGCSASCLTAVR